MWLFAGFIAFPLIEIALFVTVGGWLGLWPTLVIVIGTGVAGVMVIRWQGMRSLADLRLAAAQGRNPGGAMADSAIVAVGGMLLILPGFLTDTLGLLLMVPPLRRVLIRTVAARMHVIVPDQPFGRRESGIEVIDGEYFEVGPTPPEAKDLPPPGWTRD